eukprot:CCRYP_001938-RA/>CCRYP_001938-RA protein AED:0.86 eAED:0.86 QI:0/-1/0/1/-1/0/1/0/268
MDMCFHWLRCRINQKHVRLYWHAGATNVADYVTKHHPAIHHQAVRPLFLTAVQPLLLQMYQCPKSTIGDEGNKEHPEFLEELDESDEEEMEGDEFEVSDEYDKNTVSRQNQEPTNLEQKTVSRATANWEHYKPQLLTNGALVAYLCLSNPTIIANSKAPKDALNHIAVEKFFKRVILPRKLKCGEDPMVTLARLVDKFWEESKDYVKRQGFFRRESMWITSCDPKTVSYEWCKRYSVPAIAVFGLCACLSCSLVLDCSQEGHESTEDR